MLCNCCLASMPRQNCQLSQVQGSMQQLDLRQARLSTVRSRIPFQKLQTTVAEAVGLETMRSAGFASPLPPPRRSLSMSMILHLCLNAHYVFMYQCHRGKLAAVFA